MSQEGLLLSFQADAVSDAEVLQGAGNSDTKGNFRGYHLAVGLQ
jgi:hypothetical protein